jgi:hypothetical protein
MTCDHHKRPPSPSRLSWRLVSSHARGAARGAAGHLEHLEQPRLRWPAGWFFCAQRPARLGRLRYPRRRCRAPARRRARERRGVRERWRRRHEGVEGRAERRAPRQVRVGRDEVRARPGDLRVGPRGELDRARFRAAGRRCDMAPPPLPPRTNWTSLVPPPVLLGHVSSLRCGAGTVGAPSGPCGPCPTARGGARG